MTRSCCGDRSNAGRHDRDWSPRAQANLVALVAALFALTTATVVGVAIADGALAGESGSPGERHAASAVASGLVSDASPLTNRTNVMDGSAVERLSASALRSRYPVLDGRSVRVRLGDEVLVESGTPAGGTTMRRIVLVERSQQVRLWPRFTGGNRASLARRTTRVDVTFRTSGNTTVSTVRADERTVLHDDGGELTGTHTISVSRRETVDLTFVANGSLSRGDVRLTLYPRRTNKSELAVTVDD